MSLSSVEFSSSRALVVEDNAVNRQLVTVLLDYMGIGQIQTANDGEEGLEMVASFRPDIIILDIMMPRMDGFAFLERFRADPANAETPVLVATALGELAERVRAFDAGASDYVVKPIDRREFVARVSAHLRTRLLVTSLRRYQDRLSRDLAAARSMQQALLPKPRDIAEIESRYGIRLSSVFHSSDELGGDLWDVIPIDDQRFAIYLVDFTGHGIAAAINTFRLHLLMARKEDLLGDPAVLLERINLSLIEVLQRGQFAAMTHAVFHLAEQRVRLSIAGAPAPIHRATDGIAGMMVEKSHPLGLIAQARYREIDIPFRPGNAVLLFSDGFSEAHGANGELLGEDAIRKLAEDCDGDLDGMVERLRQAGWRFEDDLTAVWVQRV